MTFRKFEGPFSDVRLLGCRNLFLSDRLILDVGEYQESNPETVEIDGEKVESHVVGLTETSRLWRFTFERPFVLRTRDRDIHEQEPVSLELPGKCSYSEDSDWLRSFETDPNVRSFIPTHYIFELVEYTVEIIGDDSPAVEEIANELGDVRGDD